MCPARTCGAETGQRGFQRVTPAKKALGPALLILAGISLFAALLFLGSSPDSNTRTQAAKAEPASLLRITGIVEKGRVQADRKTQAVEESAQTSPARNPQ